MQLPVSGNIIETAPLRGKLTQGETGFDLFEFQLPKNRGIADLSALVYTLRAYSTKDTMAAELLEKTVTATGVTLSCTITEKFTAVDGPLTLEIVGTDLTGMQVVKYRGEPFDIKKALTGDFPPPPLDIFEQLLLAAQAAVQNAAEQAALAKTQADSAAASAEDAGKSAKSADTSAKNAAGSAANAKTSEINAKTSETASADSLTDIKAGLVSKLSIAEANALIKTISLNSKTGVFTFTRYDGTTFTIDTALEKTILNFDYDSNQKELVLQLESGAEIRIPLTDLIDDYEGVDTATVSVEINGDNQVAAYIKGNSISINLLDLALQGLVGGKVNANEDNNASQIKFADGSTMQQKLDSGELNGKDGVAASVSGFYHMYVTPSGDLMLVVNDNTDPPPLSLDANGNLIYTIGG